MANISKVLSLRGRCSIMLTGGRSAKLLYEAWAALPGFDLMHDVDFYFGDERCVPVDHPESNYGLAMRTLFQGGVPCNCEVIRMLTELTDCAAADYEAKLPDRLDVLLLSVGEDGHIASLFPHGSAILENLRRVVCVRAPKPPQKRLTVTPLTIAQAERVFVMAIGPDKAAVFNQAKADTCAISDVPARLVLNATWFFDSRLKN